MSRFNIEALREAVYWMLAEAAKAKMGLPSEWDQRDWFRRDGHYMNNTDGSPLVSSQFDWGTRCCLAGHIAEVQGARPEWTNGPITGRVRTADGRSEFIPHYAEKVLGITGQEATDLFWESMTSESVLATAKQIALNHGETL